MTPLQVFIAYAKIRGIMPELKKAENNQLRSYFEFDPQTGQHVKKNISFKGMFENHFFNNGFGYSPIYSILYHFDDGDIVLDMPKVNKAHRRWRTFVINNVILDEPLKNGAKIKYKSWGMEREGTVHHIMNDYSRILVKDENDRIQYISPGNILEVEGKPFEISFHFKWKGKEYGKK